MTRSTIYTRRTGNGPSSSAPIRDACDIETAAHAVNRINKKIHAQAREAREIKRAAVARSKITLPKMPWDEKT